MDYKEIQNILLKDGYEGIDVEIFLSYLNQLVNEKDRKGALKNPWAERVSTKNYAHVFKKVMNTGCVIDGNLVTLQFRGKLLPSYNYKAYKNRVLHVYPNTVFDVQLVRKEDKVSFKKESGKVIYSHEFNGMWLTDNENPIVGAYCIIKNQKGEFVELMNMETINQIRSVAKTQRIWDDWFGEMVKKSVIKRACKFHFEDVVKNIEEVDNENYDLEQEGVVPSHIITKIEKATSMDELQDIYLDDADSCEDKELFFTLINNRKKELEVKI